MSVLSEVAWRCLSRRPRRADDGADLPGRHDLRAERRGLSHNVREETKPEHLQAGAAVLLNAVLRLAG
jgi:hypothetical protein